jgi:hypothetical protein
MRRILNICVTKRVAHALACCLLIFVSHCEDDESSMAEDYDDESTSAEEAQKRMNNGDYQEAIDLLLYELELDPTFYELYPLLSAAYAGLAGVSLLDIVASGGAPASSSGGGFGAVSPFLPAGYGRPEIDNVSNAIGSLDQIPAELFGAEGDPKFGSSATFQYALYSLIRATMVLNLYADESGNFTSESLAGLTEADLAIILTSLAGAAGVGDPQFSASAQETVDEINAAPGATTGEQLSNYLGATP